MSFRKLRIRLFCLFVVLIFSVSCLNNRAEKSGSPDIYNENNSGSDIGTLEEIHLWNYKNPPEFQTAFLKNISDKLNISVWHTTATADNRPSAGEIGSFGIGNGSVFGFVGLNYPLNTLHSLCGPFYEKDDRFFGDFSLEFYKDAEKIEFNTEMVLRSLSGPFNVIIESSENLYIEILDFTPIPVNGADIIKRNYIRAISIKNKTENSGYSLLVKPANDQKYENHELIEEKNNAVLSTFIISGNNKDSIFYENRQYGIRVSDMENNEERVIYLIHHVSEVSSDIIAETDYIKKNLDVMKLISETINNYENFQRNTIRIKTPDKAVNHLIEGLKLTLKTQIAENGAAAPMSEYTRVWTRDLTGWIFGLLSSGAFEEVKKIISYLHYAIIKSGDIKNSYPADLNTEETVSEPDWENMPLLSDKSSAEGPSHIPIYHHIYYEYSDDITLFEKHRKLIKRSLIAQNISKEGLIPFSGDETYRAAMNAAFGLPLEYAHHENSYSPNSSILFIRAAKGILYLFRKIGAFSEAEPLQEKLSVVENAFYKYFILPDGCISAFITISTMSPHMRPFEDESLIMSFFGNRYFHPESAYNNIRCLYERIYTDKGVLLSTIDDKYKDFLGIRVRKGILTGMLPGYTLTALTENYHPEMEDAFNQIGKYADTSGNFGEYLIYDNRNTLSLIYDANGKQGDYTARFRPWEGGINLYAIINYLLGFQVLKEDMTIIIRPHLPNNWNFLEAENIRFDNSSLSINIIRNSTEYTLLIKSPESIKYKMKIIIDYPDGYIFKTDDANKYYIVKGLFGLNSAVIEMQSLKPGSIKVGYNIYEPTK